MQQVNKITMYYMEYGDDHKKIRPYFLVKNQSLLFSLSFIFLLLDDYKL